MTFTYRHRKEILISIIGLVLLLVIGGVFFYNSQLKENEEEKLVLNSDKNNLKKKNKTKEEEEVYYQIDIKGEVNSPGIYTVKENSRVIDVIRLAGDLTPNADTSVLNLSKKVTDEMVIIIYSYDEVANFTATLEKEKQEQSACLNQNEIKNDACIESDNSKETSTILDSDTKISINKATLEELMMLPGIGETKAKAIIDYRETVGSFTNIEQLKEVNGIGEATFDQIKENITI